jgi:hypothetical protein
MKSDHIPEMLMTVKSREIQRALFAHASGDGQPRGSTF